MDRCEDILRHWYSFRYVLLQIPIAADNVYQQRIVRQQKRTIEQQEQIIEQQEQMIKQQEQIKQKITTMKNRPSFFIM